MAGDYKQLGFCSLTRAHLSAELLNLAVGAPTSSCSPAGEEPLAQPWSPRDRGRAVTHQRVTSCSTAGSRGVWP